MQRFDAVSYIRDASQQIHAALNARRFDANYFISPDLEALLLEVFANEYAESKARQMVPIRPGTSGATIQKYRGLDHAGSAKWMSTGGNDVPRVDVFKEEDSIKYDSLCDSFSYNLDELEAAALSRQPLERDRAMAAREVAEAYFDDALCFGVSALNTTGLLNNADAELVTLTTGDWPTATPQEILYDFGHDLWGKIQVDTLGRREANRAVFDTDTWVLLNSTPYGTDNNSRTILQVLRENYPGVEFMPWSRLDTADAARTGPRCMVYQYSPDVASAWVASEFSLDAPEKHGFEFEVFGRLRATPGVAVMRPLCIKYADNHD